MANVPRVTRTITPFQFGRNNVYTGYDYGWHGLLTSRGNRRLKNGAWSGGGGFYCLHKTVQSDGGVPMNLRNGTVTWSGTSRGVSPPTSVPAAPTAASNASIVAELTPAFASAWARTRPGNPVVGLGQFLYELQDLPHIPGTETGKVIYESVFKNGRLKIPFQKLPYHLLSSMALFRSYGSEYLNGVFGWKPFLADLRGTYSLMKKIDTAMAQIKRDNGKGVRRGTTMQNDSSTTQTINSTYTVPLVGVGGSPVNWWAAPSSTVLTTTVSVTEKVWFVAKFTYYIPDTNSWQWDTRARAALFGVLPTPGLVWAVTPWSWLVDWFTNVGDVINNATSMNAVDNLVASYAYIMRTKMTKTARVCQTIAKARQDTNYDVRGVDHTFYTVETTTEKFRTAGTPYGLGATYSGLSNYQKGVVAALGISRANF